MATSAIESTADRRAAWLEHRKTRITGTDAAKILGLSPFGGPLDVWLEKKGQAPEKVVTNAMESGRRFERAILEWYSDIVGQPITFADSYRLIESASHPLIGATLDAIREDDGRPVDAKNNRRKSDDWGEPGTDEIPVYYACQGVFQMHVTDNARCDFVPVFSGQDIRVYTLERDADTEANVIGTCEQWWEKYIVGDLMPPVDGTEGYTNWLKEKFLGLSDMTVAATPELSTLAETLHDTKRQLKELEAAKDYIENTFREVIGDKYRLSGAVAGRQWWATWSLSKDKPKVELDALALAKELYQRYNTAAALAEEGVVPSMDFEHSFAALCDKYTTTTPARTPRKLTFTYKG